MRAVRAAFPVSASCLRCASSDALDTKTAPPNPITRLPMMPSLMPETLTGNQAYSRDAALAQLAADTMGSCILYPPTMGTAKDSLDAEQGLRLTAEECLDRWDFIPAFERNAVCAFIEKRLFVHEEESEELFLKVGIRKYGKQALLQARSEQTGRGPAFWDRVLDIITAHMVHQLPADLAQSDSEESQPAGSPGDDIASLGAELSRLDGESKGESNNNQPAEGNHP